MPIELPNACSGPPAEEIRNLGTSGRRSQRGVHGACHADLEAPNPAPRARPSGVPASRMEATPRARAQECPPFFCRGVPYTDIVWQTRSNRSDRSDSPPSGSLGRSTTYLRQNPLADEPHEVRHSARANPFVSRLCGIRRGERNGRLGRETAANTSPQNAQGRSNLHPGIGNRLNYRHNTIIGHGDCRSRHE